MKTLTWTLLLLIVVSGCSSSKIIPTQWASSDFNAEQINTLLVYANTEDKALQVDFENMVATALTNKGVTMYKMHDEFPDIEYKENPSQEEIKEFVADCKAKGIYNVLLASQKAVKVDTVRKHTLHNYMNSLQPLKLGHTGSENLEYDKKELTSYTIEAAVYDIAKTAEDKPIATTTLVAKNPKSKDKVKEQFLEAIIALFESN